MPRPVLTFARFVATPENRAAWLAVQDVAGRVQDRRTGGEWEDEAPRASSRIVLMHGPAGSGKTHLVHGLVAQVTQRRPDLVVTILAAADLLRARQPTLFANQAEVEDNADGIDLSEALHCDLLIIEDLQHLNPHAVERLVQVIDYLQARQRPIVVTANAGPQRLAHRGERFAARLTSRLTAGLVVALQPLGPRSRLTLLQTLAQRRQLAVPTEILRWLADKLSGGGRQLEGAIAQLEALAKVSRGLLDLSSVEAAFREQTDAGRVTLEKVAERVGSFFRVETRDLQSRRRCRHVMLPRQVGMYLARKLTELSLEQIGGYFGGRDHSTVLHACRKVELALDRDAILSGAIREIHAGLA